jgi:hypothetical protein
LSELLVLLNAIKTQYGPDWLTPLQRSAISSLEAHLKLPGVVNLFGPTGTGKTFCGWLLARSLDGEFVVGPGRMPAPIEAVDKTLIVDNGPDDLYGLRKLLTDLQLRNTRRAVIITRYKNELGLPAVTLPEPSPDDCKWIATQLNNYRPFYPSVGCSNLWHWIKMGME